IIGVSMARSGKLSAVLGVWMAQLIFALVRIMLLWGTDRVPVEIGLGQAFVQQIKKWSQAGVKLDGQGTAGSGARVVTRGVPRALLATMGTGIVILAVIGARSRWTGGIGFSLGDEYFYPLLFLFIIGLIILLAQRFMMILDDYVMRRFVSLLL